MTDDVSPLKTFSPSLETKVKKMVLDDAGGVGNGLRDLFRILSSTLLLSMY
jgi:hypothetical protein